MLSLDAIKRPQSPNCKKILTFKFYAPSYYFFSIGILIVHIGHKYYWVLSLITCKELYDTLLSNVPFITNWIGFQDLELYLVGWDLSIFSSKLTSSIWLN